MDNKSFAIDLEKRTLKFALQIIHISASLPYSQESKVVRNQLTKSGTSIGANYREVNRSRSKADFYHKIKICETESSETCYWLELIRHMKWCDEQLVDVATKEAHELLAIFTSIAMKFKL